MKYIRTKEGKIIDIDKRYECHLKSGWVNKKIKDKETFIKTSHHNIVKQADTIEELCDEFVYHLKSGGKFIDEELANKFDIYENIYGAIWTDKGLIYVAKMNNDGELELL